MAKASRAMQQVVVLGGGYAGVLAARRIAAGAGDRAKVTLVTATDQFVERIRLHQMAVGQAVDTRPVASLIGGAALRVARVVALEPDQRRVVLDDGALEVDLVVNALGSATRLTIPGAAAHALHLDDPASARAVGAAAAAAAGGRRPLAIVGGGLTAIEAATELAEAHPDLLVDVYCGGGLGEGALSKEAADHVRAAFSSRGIALHEHATVDAIEPDALVVGGVRTPVAGTLWCAGFASSPLAAAAGLAVDGQGRMIVGDTLAVAGHPWLYGAGDAAVTAGPVGAPLVMSCKTAEPMAVRAADNVLAALHDGTPRPFRFGDSLVCVSLGRTDGVIQRRYPDGSPRDVIGGRMGAWIKEAVSTYTVAALRFTMCQSLVARVTDRSGARVLAAGAQRALTAG